MFCEGGVCGIICESEVQYISLVKTVLHDATSCYVGYDDTKLYREGIHQNCIMCLFLPDWYSMLDFIFIVSQ